MADTSNQIHKEWEIILHGSKGQPGLKRLRVPGGWLYRTTEYNNCGTDEMPINTVAVAMVFVPTCGDFR